jgi:SAM-dependent methyltransferase
MRHDSFLKDYAEKYDTFYKDKDYKTESLFLHTIFKKYKVKRVYDIACGTGNHLLELKKLGYEVNGSDISKDMVAVAKGKGLDCTVKPMQDISCNNQDAIICMFSAFDYLTTYGDILRTLNHIYHSLKKNGIFVFDFWNKECVEKKYQLLVQREERTALTILHEKYNIAEVTMIFDEKREKHSLMYHDRNDLYALLWMCGFKPTMFPFMEPHKKITSKDWNIQVIARK